MVVVVFVVVVIILISFQKIKNEKWLTFKIKRDVIYLIIYFCKKSIFIYLFFLYFLDKFATNDYLRKWAATKNLNLAQS